MEGLLILPGGHILALRVLGSRCGCGPDLPTQNVARRRVTKAWHPLVLQVVCQVDSGHATFAKLTLDGVPALEGCVHTGDGIGDVHVLKMRLEHVNRERSL